MSEQAEASTTKSSLSLLRATSGTTLQAFQPAPGGGDWAPLHQPRASEPPMISAHRAVPVGGRGWAGACRNDLHCSAEAERGIFLRRCASNRVLRRARTREYVATEPAVYAYRSTSTTTRVVHRPRTPPGISHVVRCCQSCVLVLPPSKMPLCRPQPSNTRRRSGAHRPSHPHPPPHPLAPHDG